MATRVFNATPERTNRNWRPTVPRAHTHPSLSNPARCDGAHGNASSRVSKRRPHELAVVERLRLAAEVAVRPQLAMAAVSPFCSVQTCSPGFGCRGGTVGLLGEYHFGSDIGLIVTTTVTGAVIAVR
jgi:hypothetical protein